jgi:NADPH:quinone reductase-like Zn-dependent oxidoreductase
VSTGSRNDMMKAVIFDRYGSSAVLKYADVPKPEPGMGEVRLKIKACGLNAADIMAREGRYKPNETFPHILGNDVAGVVDAYGPECQQPLPVGAGALMYWVRACGKCEQCLRGFPNTCLHYRYYGAHLPGGYAEYVVFPEDNLVPLGDFDDWIRAAAFPMVFGTTWHMLITRARIAPGETMLVQAAGSGIGMAGIQIGRLVGTTIIASAGSDEKLEKAKELGAHYVVNYTKNDLREEVMRITGKRGVDVVSEHVGGGLWDASVRCLTRNGRLVTSGGTAGYDVHMNVAHVFHKQLTLIGSNSATKWEVLQITRYLQDGTFDPVVDKVFPLEEAAAAQDYLSERKQFGKVVLAIDL